MTRANTAATSACVDGKVDYKLQNYNNLPALFGPSDLIKEAIENELGVTLDQRGDKIVIMGEKSKKAKFVLGQLEDKIKNGQDIDIDTVKDAIATHQFQSKANSKPENANSVNIHIKGREIVPRTPGQVEYLQNLATKWNVFGVGEAGTGKTFLAVAKGLSMLLNGDVERLYLCRPAVEAGENLGFLPGTQEEKVDPYMRPLYDALYEFLPAQKKESKGGKGNKATTESDPVQKLKDEGLLEVAPLALMRGRNLKNAFIILDEAQNATHEQMKMFLTRQQNSIVAVNGDITQCDLPPGVQSGLQSWLEILEGNDAFGITRFTEADIVRDPMVKAVIEAEKAYKERPEALPGTSASADHDTLAPGK